MTSNNFNLAIFEIDKAKNLVNLTKIATAFDKRIDVWLRNEKVQEFLTKFDSLTPNGGSGIVIIREGSTQNTWAHRKIALKFAQWISVDFELFCNEKLDELFQTGATALQKPLSTLDLFELSLRQMKEQ